VQRDFRIGPFDTIAVAVFNAPDLAREGMVDSTGTFPMPLIGPIQVAGLTPDQVGAQIADRLRGRYVRNPQVTVAVREVRSRRLTVDGAVRQPGIYPIIGRMTLQQAIATARGADENARLDEVVIFRNVNNQQLAARFDLRSIRAGQLTDPEVYPDDIVLVGDNAGRRRLREILQAIPILGVFTPYFVR
jgi:polysaccharide export outer membrane protein